MGEYRKVPEEGLGREEQPDCRCFRPSLAHWASGWDQGERMGTRRRCKQLPAPEATYCSPGGALPGIQWLGPVLLRVVSH